MSTIRRTREVEGLKDLERALAALPKATGRSVLRRALLAGGAPIAEDAERRAPLRKGNLKRSIGVSTKLTKRQKAVHRRYAGTLPPERVAGGFRSQPAKSVFVFVGPGSLPAAVPQEFGTVNHPAQPYMRPAWDTQQDRALAIIVERIGAEIKSAVERLAKKAAREAAKMKAGK